MKKPLLPLILCAGIVLPQAARVRGATSAYNPAIEKYVRFLQQQKQTPVDYILRLFQTYDLVVLCERCHTEATQYEMIYQLVADPRFQQQAGHVFMENGSHILQNAVEEFLMDDGLTEPQAYQKHCRIFRDFDWDGSSDRTNVFDFFKNVHDLNQSLPKDLRVHLYPCDLDCDWTSMTKERYGEVCKQLGRRDQIMANHVMEKVNEIRQAAKRNKALVIMNYRHAFPHVSFQQGGQRQTVENVTGFLRAAYPDKVANVMINNVRLLPGSTDDRLAISAIQDGKWDAAFAVQGYPSLGFDFKGSPFGGDEFDYFAVPFSLDRKYQDVFTGYVFYKPLDDHRMTCYIPGVLEPAFAAELLKRCQIMGLKRSAAEIAQEIERSQSVRICGYENRQMYPKSDYDQKIRQWLVAKR